MYNIGFTGHRVISDIPETELFRKLCCTLETLIQGRQVNCYTGGALGFDTLAALATLDLRKRYPDLHLHLLLPFPQQHKNWNRSSREQFQQILSQADSVTYAYDRYLPGVYHLRDRAIVEHSDVILAYMNQKQGGTVYTVNLARQMNKEIINLAYTL